MRKVWPYVGICVAVAVGVRIAPFIEWCVAPAFLVWWLVPASAWRWIERDLKGESEAEYTVTE